MNPQHLDNAVKTALRSIGKSDPALIRLIKMTFLFESDLYDFFTDPENNSQYHGFSQISQSDLRHFLYDYVELRDIRNKMEKFCVISFKQNSLEEIWHKLRYDISLQIMITYGIYDSRFPEIPEDNLESLFECYRKYWRDGQAYTEKEKTELLYFYMNTFTS